MADQSAFLDNMNSIRRNGLGAPVLLMVMMAMIVVPLAPFMLDVFFTFNISLALVVLLVTVYSLRPLDFSLFPTILLVTTLLRLQLVLFCSKVIQVVMLLVR